MGECNLDWKKVFKEILGPPSNKKSLLPAECSDSSIVSNIASSNNKVVKTDYCESNYKPTNNTIGKNPILNRKESTQLLNPCSLDIKDTTSNLNKSGEVPQWNVVFKSILGNKSKLNNQEDKIYNEYCSKEQDSSLQKPDMSQKQMEQIKNKCYRHKKTPEKIFKSKKMDKEEKEVRELFARSRLFKPDSTYRNINDYAGTFKRDKVLPSLPQPVDNRVSVGGLVANIKPLTREDILNSPCVSCTEVWDDDLLF